MRAYQLPKGGAGIDALTKVERPNPKPGHRQVLVKVAACSINFRDLGIVRGTYRMPSKENVVPLSDGAGEVVEVGSGVTRVKVGDKVAGNFFARWPGGEPPPDVETTARGGATDGMLAEYVALEEGATLPCAGVTVWHAMMEHGRMIAGQTVLLQGTGGVSVFGLQLAHAMGMQSVITSSSDDKLAKAKKLGANHTINYKTTPDWEKAAMEFTGGRGVDHVVEVGGAGTFAKSFGAIRLGGKISMIGNLSGPATELNPALIMGRRANIQGISVGSTQMFEAMNRMIAANAIKPVIDKVFGFDEVKAAYQHMASGAHFGKIVIR